MHVNSLVSPALISMSTVCASNYILALLRACGGGRSKGKKRGNTNLKYRALGLALLSKSHDALFVICFIGNQFL